MDPALSGYRSDQQLSERVASISRGGSRPIFAGVVNSSGSFMASSAGPDRLLTGLPVGCFAKPLTATLVAYAAAQGWLRFGDDVGFLLEECCFPIASKLRGISVSQLLTHSHGLDGSSLQRVPRLSDGRIDVWTLVSVLTTSSRLAQPGAFYSYGNAGAWIAAALLEEMHGRCWVDVLNGHLPDLLQSPAEEIHGDPLPGEPCPAVGGSVRLNLRQLVRFVAVHLDRHRVAGSIQGRALDLMRVPAVAVPGWSREAGATAGWKTYGGGWLGHDMHWNEWSGCIRLNRTRDEGFVLVAKGVSAYVVQSRLFGCCVPDVLGHPSSAAANAQNARDLSACVGEFGNAARRLKVMRSGDCRLRVVSTSDEVILRPVGERLLMSDPPHRDLRFVEFLAPTGGRYAYLWNSTEVLPRISPKDEMARFPLDARDGAR